MRELLGGHVCVHLTRARPLAAILGMACDEDNTIETKLQVHRLLVRMARNAPQAWVELLMPPLLDVQRLALRDSLESASLQALTQQGETLVDAHAEPGYVTPTPSGSETPSTPATPELPLEEGARGKGEVLLLPGGLRQVEKALEGGQAQRGQGAPGEGGDMPRTAFSASVNEWLQTLVAGSVLAVAVALPCPALEAHVRQVLTERRQAGQECAHLRICENGDLEALETWPLGTSQDQPSSSAAPLAVCTQVLDLTEMVHALASSQPHLARVLAAHGGGGSEGIVRHALPHALPLVRICSIGITGDQSSEPATATERSPGALSPESLDLTMDGTSAMFGGGAADGEGASGMPLISLAPSELLEPILQHTLPAHLLASAEAQDAAAEGHAGVLFMGKPPAQDSFEHSLLPARLIRQALASHFEVCVCARASVVSANAVCVRTRVCVCVCVCVCVFCAGKGACEWVVSERDGMGVGAEGGTRRGATQPAIAPAKVKAASQRRAGSRAGGAWKRRPGVDGEHRGDANAWESSQQPQSRTFACVLAHAHADAKQWARRGERGGR